MTKTTYTLLLRDHYPMVRRDEKKTNQFNWRESETSGSLKRIRKAEKWLKEYGEKTKIIREQTTISLVKKGDLK